MLVQFFDSHNGTINASQLKELSKTTELTPTQCYDWINHEKTRRKKSKLILMNSSMKN